MKSSTRENIVNENKKFTRQTLDLNVTYSGYYDEV